MGTFNVTVEIGNSNGQVYESIEALVDTGASYTVVPTSTLRRLGVQPRYRRTFKLADGSRQEYGMGETRMRLEGEEHVVPVVFGGDNASALLGAVSLEIFGLGVDMMEERLIHVDGLLM